MRIEGIHKRFVRNLVGIFWRSRRIVADETQNEALTQSDLAWNNFIFNSKPGAYDKGTLRWAAALAARFMGGACNGGLNSFLTHSPEIDPQDVLQALRAIGAHATAQQLDHVLSGIGVALPAASEQERWDALARYWVDELDVYDCLSDEADADLIDALSAHVRGEESYYLSLTTRKPEITDTPPRE
jgi:hypothetical protein